MKQNVIFCAATAAVLVLCPSLFAQEKTDQAKAPAKVAQQAQEAPAAEEKAPKAKPFDATLPESGTPAISLRTTLQTPLFDATLPESGTPADYLTFAKNLQQRKTMVAAPEPTNQEEFEARVEAVFVAVNAATTKVIESNDASSKELDQAVEMKVNALHLLSQITDDEKYEKELQQMPSLLRKIGKEEQAKALEYEFLAMDVARAVGLGNKEAIAAAADKLFTEVKQAGKDIPRPLLQAVATVMRDAQYCEDSTITTDLYNKYVPVLENSENTRLQELAESLKGFQRRLALTSTKMLVDGKFLDGSDFDAAEYEGKIVLVDFWATWCGPCVGEIPNVKKMYEFYHEKGFDVIGISCDRDKKSLEKFLKERKIPWKQMLDSDTKVGDKDLTMSDYYGVSGIPTMILLDKDGKAISISARGNNLKKLLEEKLGKYTAPKSDDTEDEEVDE